MKIVNSVNGVNNSLDTDYVNLFHETINIIKRTTETLSDSSKELGIEVDAHIITRMFISRHQTAGQNHNSKITRNPAKMW